MTSSDTINQLLTVNKQLAAAFTVGISATAEGALKQGARCSPYGEQFIQSVQGIRTPALAEEGSYSTFMNVPQTAILDAASLTAFVATTPTMVIFNSNSVASGKNLYLQRFRCSVSAAGTSGTNWLWQWLLDTGNRYTSGGTLLTEANLQINATALSGAIVHFGAVTAPAANASRIVGAGVGRTVLKVIGDEYTFEFGNSGPVSGAGMPTDGTLQLTKTWHVPPLVIPPQCSALWYEYAASQGTAAQFDNIAVELAAR